MPKRAQPKPGKEDKILENLSVNTVETGPKRGKGRPRKQEGERTTRTRGIRLRASEDDTLTAAALRSGQTVGAILRQGGLTLANEINAQAATKGRGK